MSIKYLSIPLSTTPFIHPDRRGGLLSDISDAELQMRPSLQSCQRGSPEVMELLRFTLDILFQACAINKSRRFVFLSFLQRLKI